MLGSEASIGMTEITELQASQRPLTDAWKDPSIPEQQLQLTDGEIRRWRAGETIAPFMAFTKALLSLPRSARSLLEVGCGVGHYAELVPTPDFVYTGVDYSEAFIEVARKRRPWWKFEVQDALALDMADREFDTVVSGCCLIHIMDWKQALKESARVARSYVILHRTPVSDEPTRYFTKKAYGVECIELHFNRGEIIEEMDRHEFVFRNEIPVTPEQSTLVFERPIFHHQV